MIVEKTVYITKGKQFDSLKLAEEHRDDLLGEFMDQAPILLGPGQRLKLNEFMVTNRRKLINLLDY